MKAKLIAFTKTKTAEQLYRVLRITAFGVVAAIALGSPISVVLVAGLAEAAYRQVFPVAT